MITLAVPMISTAILIVFAIAWATEAGRAEARPIRMLNFRG